MATVVWLSDHYANFLVHPLLSGPGVADAVVPVSLALKGEQYANEPWRYKNTAGPQHRYLRMGLAPVAFPRPAQILHRGPLRRTSFDVVTTGPSTSGRADHPLHTMVGATNGCHHDLLTSAPDTLTLGRTASPARYTSSTLWGEKVLLIDDTWTTGQHAQSAAAVLKAAGAGSVAIVVLGRHVNISYGDTAPFVEQARLRRFTWDVCALRSWSHSEIARSAKPCTGSDSMGDRVAGEALTRTRLHGGGVSQWQRSRCSAEWPEVSPGSSRRTAGSRARAFLTLRVSRRQR
ncbi:hypothetical protein [Streptomyces sp. NPDC050988]|uniref:hypothetical protein n=1 Tax=Streptomyces sp. NPDC050988 TaxID=3365637 RepID=UPI0037AA3B14